MANISQILAGTGNGNGTPAWANESDDAPGDVPGIAQRAIDIYMLSKQDNGQIGGLGWWQSANGYTAMAFHDIWTRSNGNYQTLAAALRQCEQTQSHFINEFNDDTMWWGLCSLHVYTIGKDPWFLEQAQAVWQHVSKYVVQYNQFSWAGQDMQGAVWWTSKPGEGQLNSITTGLFAELSLRLAAIANTSGLPTPSRAKRLVNKLLNRKQLSGDQYVNAAKLSLGWILRCRFRQPDAIVLDNIEIRGTPKEVDWTFTYLTGQALGTCALMYQATGDNDYVTLACRMARQAVQRAEWVDPDGVLTERGAYGPDNHQATEDDDAVGFKAILMRHLGILYGVIRSTNSSAPEAQDTAALIKKFVNVNIQSQQQRNTNNNGQYGPWWDGPFDTPTSHSQMAVLDVMSAALLVNSQ